MGCLKPTDTNTRSNLPYDSNGDGRLDRILIHVPDGLDADARRVIGRLRRLWQRGGGEWQLLLEGMGSNEVGHELTRPSQRWVSATPLLASVACQEEIWHR